MNTFLFLGTIFFFTLILGSLLEKIRVPWVFAALILGLAFAFYNPFPEITSSPTFEFLAWMGMYFLLFLIGFELDIKKIKKLGKFIIKSTFFIILFESIFGSLLIHFVFQYNWFISFLVAISFATVGEAILIPILEEFNLIKTKLGQTILGIGVFDDIIEILVLILAITSTSIFLKTSNEFSFNIQSLFIPLVLLGIIILIAVNSRKINAFLAKIKGKDVLFLLSLSLFFLFTGLNQFAEAATLGPLFAGIFIKNFFSKEKTESIEPIIKIVAYSFLGPIFFFWIGMDVDIKMFSPLLILAVILVSYGAKILASYIAGKKHLGTKPSILMGVALGIRFSTSLVIIKLLFEKQLIDVKLYSILIASSIVFKFVVPFLLSFLIQKWKTSVLKNA